jgi:hypothetical protein
LAQFAQLGRGQTTIYDEEEEGAALLEAEKRTKTTAFRDADTTLARAALAAIARQAQARR